jgi:hypothetical protein
VREKSGMFANRNQMNRKQWLYGDTLKNDAAYLWSHPHLPEKMARKSTPFFDKNQFANRRAFQVYCVVASLKIDVLRATTNGLFRQNDETPAFYPRHWRDCSGLPRMEGTERLERIQDAVLLDKIAVACPEWRGLKV